MSRDSPKIVIGGGSVGGSNGSSGDGNGASGGNGDGDGGVMSSGVIQALLAMLLSDKISAEGASGAAPTWRRSGPSWPRSSATAAASQPSRMRLTGSLF